MRAALTALAFLLSVAPLAADVRITTKDGRKLIYNVPDFHNPTAISMSSGSTRCADRC